MQSHVENLDMIKKRHENQVKLSLKKGRVSGDKFLVNDRMVIQNNWNGKWEEEEVIMACRKADDQSTQSYEIKMSSGNVKLRNKRFIKHVCKEDTHGDRQVYFQPSNNTQHDNRGQEDHEAAQREPDSERENRAGPLTRSRTRS